MSNVFHLPRPGAVFRHALPTLVESTVLPVVIFYAALRSLGTTGAIVAALVWAYGAVLVRVVRGKRIPGLLWLSVLTLTVRTALSLATGSVFLYFLQPTLGTMALAAGFLLSVPARRPLAEKLAHDLIPLPASWLSTGWISRFFTRITLLWAGVFLANGLISLWLLLHQSVGTYVLSRTAVSSGSTVLAIGVSVWFFVRSARHNGAHVVLPSLRRAIVPVGEPVAEPAS